MGSRYPACGWACGAAIVVCACTSPAPPPSPRPAPVVTQAPSAQPKVARVDVSFESLYRAKLLALAPAEQDIVALGWVTGGIRLGEQLHRSPGGDDILLARFGPDGTPQWSHRFGGKATQRGTHLVVLPDGDIAIAGQYAFFLSFGDIEHRSKGRFDLFVARFSPAGELRWDRTFGGPKTEVVTGLVALEDGSLAIGGWYSGSFDFGGQPLPQARDVDGFFAHLGPGGEHRASYGFGGPGNQKLLGLAAHPSGDLVLTGLFDHTLNLGDLTAPPQPAGTPGSAATPQDSGKQATGNKTTPSPTPSETPAADKPQVRIKPEATITSGQHQPSPTLAQLVNAGYPNLFVARVHPDGTVRWNRSFGDGQHRRQPNAAHTTAAGDIVVTGTFRSTLDLGGGELRAVGEQDIFAMSLSATGTPQWQWSTGLADRRLILEATSVRNDGETLLVGHVEDGEVTIPYLLRVDSEGATRWHFDLQRWPKERTASAVTWLPASESLAVAAVYEQVIEVPPGGNPPPVPALDHIRLRVLPAE